MEKIKKKSGQEQFKDDPAPTLVESSINVVSLSAALKYGNHYDIKFYPDTWEVSVYGEISGSYRWPEQENETFWQMVARFDGDYVFRKFFGDRSLIEVDTEATAANLVAAVKEDVGDVSDDPDKKAELDSAIHEAETLFDDYCGGNITINEVDLLIENFLNHHADILSGDPLNEDEYLVDTHRTFHAEMFIWLWDKAIAPYLRNRLKAGTK